MPGAAVEAAVAGAAVDAAVVGAIVVAEMEQEVLKLSISSA